MCLFGSLMAFTTMAGYFMDPVGRLVGLQLQIQEAGNGLSGGEKQRIALARAFLKKSNFYILDESTSNLDFATEISSSI